MFSLFMKFSFHSFHDQQTCLDILNSMSEYSLSTGKIFNGAIKKNTFSFDYTLLYRDTSSSIHHTKKLPYCSISGTVTSTGSGTLIEGNVTIVKARVLIISIIFTLVLIPIALFLYSKDVSLKLMLYILPAYGLFFAVEFFRYYNYRNEAVEQFKKLF
jgi:hypothetical protein